MRKLLAALFAGSLLVSPALADWTGKDASGATITFKNANTCSSVVCVPISEPVDSTGAAFGVTGNPLFIGFGTGVTLPAFAAIPAFKIDQTTPGTTNAVFVSNTNANGQATSANSSPVVIASDQSAVKTSGAINVTPTDCSGSITTGGTAQNALAAQTTLHGLTIMNIDTTEPLWISFTTTAAASTAGSFPLQAATATTFASPGSFTTPNGFGTNHALSVIAATTGHKWSCTWW